MLQQLLVAGQHPRTREPDRAAGRDRRDKTWITDEDLPFELQVAELDRDARPDDSLLDRALATFERNFILRALERSRVERHAARRATWASR